MRDASSAAKPRSSSLIRTGTLGVLILATVTACGTALQTHASTSASARPPSGAASTSPASGPTPGNHPLVVFYQTTPQAEFATVPSGAKLTVLDSAASSKDGLTLYLGFEADGGKCGMYDVVLEPSSKDMGVGVVHRATSEQACPMQETEVQIVVKLSTPLGLRPVLDLATGKLVLATAA